MVLLLSLEPSFGTPFAMNFVTSPRELSKNILINEMQLFSLVEAEDDYVELPILLQKIANYRANTEFNL